MSKEIDWEDVPDDELEETLWERIEGLGEMFPKKLVGLVHGTVDWTKWTAETGLWLTRNAVWIAATTSLIMFLPYIIEKERSDLEKTQVAQQRQMLLGPSAAVQAANKQQQQ